MNDIVTVLTAELRRLELELGIDPRVHKIERIKGLLELYGADASTGPVTVPVDAIPDRSDEVHLFLKERSALSKATKIKAEIDRLLREQTVMHRTEILQHLVSLDLMGHENKPIASLAAYLLIGNNTSWLTGREISCWRAAPLAANREHLAHIGAGKVWARASGSGPYAGRLQTPC